jgi:hypothetical protein
MQERGGGAARGLRGAWRGATMGRAQLWLLGAVAVASFGGATGTCTDLSESCSSSNPGSCTVLPRGARLRESCLCSHPQPRPSLTLVLSDARPRKLCAVQVERERPV